MNREQDAEINFLGALLAEQVRHEEELRAGRAAHIFMLLTAVAILALFILL